MTQVFPTDYEAAVNAKLAQVTPAQWQQLKSAMRAANANPAYTYNPKSLPSPYCMTETALAIISILDKMQVMVPFGWMHWKQGQNLLSAEHRDRLSQQPAHRLVAMLTMLIRANRFNDGTWCLSIENGVVGVLVDALCEKHT